MESKTLQSNANTLVGAAAPQQYSQLQRSHSKKSYQSFISPDEIDSPDKEHPYHTSAFGSQVDSRANSQASSPAITALAKALDLCAVMRIDQKVPQLPHQPNLVRLLYSRPSFNALAGKQQIFTLGLPTMIEKAAIDAANEVAGQGVQVLMPFKVEEESSLDCYRSEKALKRVGRSTGQQSLSHSGSSCLKSRGQELKCYVISDCGQSYRSDCNQDCGVTGYAERRRAMRITQPMSLVLWTAHALSTSQKYCIEQQLRLMQLTERLATERDRSNQKISLLEQAVRQVDHQLRTPLSLVELHTDLLSGYVSSGCASSGHAAAEVATKPIQAIRQIVSDMSVSLKRLASCGLTRCKQAEVCDLGAVMQKTVQMIRPQSEQKQVSILCDRLALPMAVDAWQMQQVFHNLLHNAIAFSPQKSVVDCRWQVYQQEVLIEIRDQGPGFSPQDLKFLFDPYYSRREGGTGLGLAIAHKVILDHKGTIVAANLPEGGAQIAIMLPRNSNIGSL